MKAIIVLLTITFMSGLVSAHNHEPLPSHLEALKNQATSLMMESLSESETAYLKQSSNIDVVADGLSSIGNNAKVEKILKDSLKLKSSKEMLNFMNKINGEFSPASLLLPAGNIGGPVFLRSRCCFCGDCE